MRKKNYPILIKLEYFFKAFFLDKVHVGTKYLNNRFDFDKIKDFNGKIIFIVNKKTASTAECFILSFRNIFKNVMIIGENTSGACCYGEPIEHELKYSKIRIQIPIMQTIYADNFSKSLDSDYGIVPDLWSATKEDLFFILNKLGVDDDLLPKIKDFFLDN